MSNQAVGRLRDITTAKVTRSEIAKRCGVSAQTVSDWLAERYKPSLERMALIEEITGGEVSITHWIDDSEKVATPDPDDAPAGSAAQ